MRATSALGRGLFLALIAHLFSVGMAALGDAPKTLTTAANGTDLSKAARNTLLKCPTMVVNGEVTAIPTVLIKPDTPFANGTTIIIDRYAGGRPPRGFSHNTFSDVHSTSRVTTGFPPSRAPSPWSISLR